MSDNQTNARTTVGKVISNKMDKTIVVLVERKVRHPKYGKFTKKSTKIHAHCEESLNEGDMVRIAETRPVSKTKSWKFVERISGNE